ncbi:MAG: decaprenyl-phosphate phosphoribosyltransferase [Bacilli bacterium]|nr:decaprenyl-phosphate phosphoribosyltransferase [Bacilli bacterium]
MKYLKLIRVKHYLKNVLIFLPAIFAGIIFDGTVLFKTLIAFLSFSFTSSIIYVINDIRDAESDRNHPVKKNRPIASGAVPIPSAVIVVIVLLLITIALLYFSNLLFNFASLILVFYLIMNLLYSFGLKNIPLIDVAILAFGFVIRVIYGGAIIDVEVSNWLFLTVLSVSFYMALGKRRNELLKSGDKNTRKVLTYYNKDFLDKNMYMFLALAIVFYSLWSTMAINSDFFKYSVIFVILIMMKYSMNVENGGYGDPVDVILNDKVLILLTMLYIVFTVGVLYI